MNICIIGVGNIGMRYYEGIAATFADATLYLVDQPERLKELSELALPRALLLPSLDAADEQVDLFVVSTSCRPRLALYKQCLAHRPRYVILDKYLFSSRDQFEQCLALHRVPTFVNQWMYGSKAFDCLFRQDRQHVELRGSGWGLACNAVHWIDVFKRHLGIAQLIVAEGTQITSVLPAKRPGYEEITGTLVFKDRHSDKTITLIDEPETATVDGMSMHIDGENFHFNYREILKDGAVLGTFPYFSTQIGGIVRDLISTGRCELPSLEESVSQHLLIEDVLDTLDRRPLIT